MQLQANFKIAQVINKTGYVQSDFQSVNKIHFNLQASPKRKCISTFKYQKWSFRIINGNTQIMVTLNVIHKLHAV